MGFLMCSSPLKAAGQDEGRLTLTLPFSVPSVLLSLHHISPPLPNTRPLFTFFLSQNVYKRMRKESSIGQSKTNRKEIDREISEVLYVEGRGPVAFSPVASEPARGPTERGTLSAWLEGPPWSFCRGCVGLWMVLCCQRTPHSCTAEWV